MKEIFLKSLELEREHDLLNLWRRGYQAGDLEIPHGFDGWGGHVETALATKGNRLVGSLTALDAVILDPFIHDPAASHNETFGALLKLETYLTHAAHRRTGAVDAYLAIPNQLREGYGRLLEHYGYVPTVVNCTVYRRALRPDTVPLLGPERDRIEAERRAAQSQATDAEGLK